MRSSTIIFCPGEIEGIENAEHRYIRMTGSDLDLDITMHDRSECIAICHVTYYRIAPGVDFV